MARVVETLVQESRFLQRVLEVAQGVSAINRCIHSCAEHQVPGIALPLVAGGNAQLVPRATGDGPNGTIKDEHTARLSNEPGTLSMANTGAPNSGSSQVAGSPGGLSGRKAGKSLVKA